MRRYWITAALAAALLGVAGCEPASSTPAPGVHQVQLADGFANQTVDVRCDQQLLFSGRLSPAAQSAGALIDIPLAAGNTPDIRIGVNGRWFRPPLNFFQGCRAELRYFADQAGRIDSRMIDPCLSGPRLPVPTYRPENYQPAPEAVTTVAPIRSAPTYTAPVYTPAPAPAPAPPSSYYAPPPTTPSYSVPLATPGTVMVVPETYRPGAPVPVTDFNKVPVVSPAAPAYGQPAY